MAVCQSFEIAPNRVIGLYFIHFCHHVKGKRLLCGFICISVYGHLGSKSMIILMGKRVLYGYFIIVYSLTNFSTICHAPTPLSLSKYVPSNVLISCGIKSVMGHWVDELRYIHTYIHTYIYIWLLLLDGSDIHHSAYIEVLFFLKLFHTYDLAIRFGLY